MIVGCSIDKISGADPNALAIQFGSGPIPDTVLEKYLTNCDLYFALTAPGTTNMPLALFRAKRHASVNQFIALVFRDRGCVKCGAPPQKCQAHHLMPWSAPAKGETNLDNLVLVCTWCHGELHKNKLTLFFDTDHDMWATRPATPDEIAPPRPQSGAKRPRGRPKDSSRQPAPA